MKKIKPTLRLCLAFLLLAIVPLMAKPLPALAHPHASQSLSIDFDLEKGLVRGTSRITLPPETPLLLSCGPLQITGAVLEQAGQTPLSVIAGENNQIALDPSANEQTLYISWELHTNGQYGSDNLVSQEGITLAGFWHPLPDRDMLYSLQARLPSGFSGVSEADVVQTSTDRYGKYMETTFDQLEQSIHFIAGPYVVASRTLSSMTVYSYFFKEDAPLAEAFLDKAVEYITRYEAQIGPFPYKRYSIVENRLPTGYGMPTFTLLGQAVVRLPFIKDTSLGHEILHSWFGNSVKTRSEGGNWCEGLTTYLADYAYAEDKGEGKTYRKDQLVRYDAYVHTDNSMRLAEFANASHAQPMARKVRSIGYDKASMLFHMLRREVGDEVFAQGLQRFYERFQGKQAGWSDLRALFTEHSGRDLNQFFTQWLERPDIPNLRVEHIKIDQENGGSRLSFHLRQQNDTPYTLQVPVRIQTLTGSMSETLTLTETEQEFRLYVDSLPSALLIDPENDLMRHLTDKEVPPTWAHLMGAREKNVVLPADEETAYAPISSFFEQQGWSLRKAEEVRNADLIQGTYLFLGSSAHSRSLFSDPGHPKTGFTLDVRANPLADNLFLAMVTSSSAEESKKSLRKLSHYGKYSFLHFEEGRIQQKRIASVEDGIHVKLITPPQAIPTANVLSFTDIIRTLEQSRVVYVGETHTDYASHLLQLQVIQALHQRDPELAIGMEMFPRSSQQALDDYISGTIPSEEEFIKASDYYSVWGFDYRLYQDIIAYARKHAIPIVGLNLDKKIVSAVFRDGGTDILTEEQLTEIAEERNLDMPGYRDRLRMVHSQHQQKSEENSFSGFIQSQAMWDETMAESISTYLTAHPQKRMVVIAGTGHVFKDSAIPPRVAHRLPVQQSVLMTDNGMHSGVEQGRQVDYLVFTEPMQLAPAGKIGVALNMEKDQEDEEKEIVRIVQISTHGKAGQAGVKENDIILSVNDHPVNSIFDLRISLLNKAPGEKVMLTLLREHDILPDEQLDIEVELSNMETSGMMMPPGHPKKP